MRARNKAVVGTAILLTAVSVLTGCGRSEGGAAAKSTSAAVDHSPAKGKVQMWAFNAEGQALASLAKEFEKQNPDVDIVITPVPNDELPRKVEAAIASGNVPDIVQPSTALPSYVATDGLAAVPDGLVKESDYFPAAVDSVKVNGTMYAVPWYVNVQTFFYNKKLAEAAGVKAPTKWEQLPDFGLAMKKAGAAQGLWTNSSPTDSWQAVLTYIYQAGGTVLKDGKFTLDTPEVVKALKYYQSLYQGGASDPTYQPELGAAIGEFASGKLGSLTSGSFLYQYLVDATKDASMVGAVALPAGPDSNASYLGGSGLSVFKDAPNADAAWKFIRFLTEVKSQQSFYGADGVLPATEAAWKSGKFASDPIFEAFRKQLESSVATPSITTWTQVRTDISAVGEQLARGQITPESAAKQLQSQLESVGTGD